MRTKVSDYVGYLNGVRIPGKDCITDMQLEIRRQIFKYNRFMKLPFGIDYMMHYRIKIRTNRTYGG